MLGCRLPCCLPIRFVRASLIAAVLLAGGAPAVARLASAQEPAAAATPLGHGLVLTRDMQTGEVHRYSIELHAGQYLQVLVEQQGVDVVQTLRGPDGAVVLETDSPAGFLGADPLAAIAPREGTYELSLKADAVAVPPRGRYELRVEAIRDPTSTDLLRVRAVQAIVEGLRLVKKDPRAPLDAFRTAASLWEAAGDPRMQMLSELMVGFTFAQGFEQHAEAAEWLSRALARALELRDEWAEARLRYMLAGSQRRLGRLDEAKANLDQALALHRAAGREADAASVLASLGNFHHLAGEPQAALDVLDEALRSFQASLNPRGEATTRITVGSVYLHLGDADLALEQFRAALSATEASDTYRTRTMGGADSVRARAISWMAQAHQRLGDYEQARQRFAEALALFKTLGNRVAEADTYLALGDLHLEQGDLGAARAAMENALSVHRARANIYGEASAQCWLGRVYRRQGELARAREAFQAAQALAPRAGVMVGACAEEGLARLSLDAGELDSALALAASALKTSESRRMSIAGQRIRAAALAEDQARYELLIDILMRKHEGQPSAGHDVAAFDVSERARARTLLELLGEGAVDVRRGVAPELLAEERSVRRRLNTAASGQAEALAAGRAERAESLERDLARLSAELAEVEGRIRRASPQYAALTQSQPLELDEIRADVLDPDTQLLEYALGEERSYLWVASRTRLDSFRLAPRAEIEAAARRVQELMSVPPAAGGDAKGSLRQARRELSRLVIEPAARVLGARRLVVVAPGALQYVPLGALALPDQAAVLARFEVVSTPSASVIASGRAAGGSHAPRTAAVFADPVFDTSDPRLSSSGRSTRGATPPERPLQALRARGVGGAWGRLPFSGREADVIVALAPRGSTLKAIGFAANREAAAAAGLAEYRIVHFATHGVLDTRRPELSGVVLSLFDGHGRKQDGFLRLHDIYNLRLDADLVVLSGCQTALGKDLRGEGLVGLTRGFMYAGARSVVASLWRVDDESTAELMKRFYRGMLKEKRRPADALRAAQLEMSRDRRWSAPFYWAGFILQGEWQ
jgi:CHAT domain-containing protein/Tfp pilus assembly protein PilF